MLSKYGLLEAHSLFAKCCCFLRLVVEIMPTLGHLAILNYLPLLPAYFLLNRGSQTHTKYIAHLPHHD